MSAKSNKNTTQLLLPGEASWELWLGTANGQAMKLREFPDMPGSFTKEATKHQLALPATALWVLPAWIKGEASHLRDMAQLHLERMSVRIPDHEQAYMVDSLGESEDGHLARIIALRDVPAPLADFTVLPTECSVSAACYPLPSNSIILWRELGKLVAAITTGPRLAYFTALSSSTLDQNGLAELNNICLQLSFQRVLTSLERIVLWTHEGDVDKIHTSTGLDVARQDRPAPRIGLAPSTTLMPAEVLGARDSAQSSAKRRVMLLTAGFALCAVLAGFAMLIGWASKERDTLREQVAMVMPKASKVGQHKAAWVEVGSAVDPDLMPMGMLLRCMEPSSSSQIAVTHFECTGDTIILRGRAPDASPALKYIEELKNTESLGIYTWESGTPQVGAQGTEFEIKGTRS
jgi:hypothetical protein